jgi:hypothetical protein
MKPRLSLVLSLLFLGLAIASVGANACQCCETLRILIPEPSSPIGLGDFGPVWDLAECIHCQLSAPWCFRVLVEHVAMETVTTEWVLRQRMCNDLPDLAIVPLWLARELSERRLLVNLEKAPIIDPAYYPCEPWNPVCELPGWVRLVNVNPVPYTDVTNPWACREAIRIPDTGEYVIVLFEPVGIYEDPERYVCERSANIRNALEFLWYCIGADPCCCCP